MSHDLAPSRALRATVRRRAALFTVVLAIVGGVTLPACGGGSDTPTGGNNNGNGGGGGGGSGGNNNVIGPPASLVVESGDTQSDEPGFALASPIVVLVRDSASKAVPSTTISIVVDSGGGTVATTSATTGTDGRATLGAWTVGATEGAQVLRIVAGSVTAKARATARIAATTLPVSTAPASGGTITVNTAGSSLNGLAITVPSGAYTTAKPVGISYTSSSTLAAPIAGATIVSPLITITGLDARAANDMTLRIPAKIPAGQTPVVLVKNPASNQVAPLRLLSFDATSVTVSFRALDGNAVADVNGTLPPFVNPMLPTSILANTQSSFMRKAAWTPMLNTSLQAPGPAQVYTITIPDADIFRNRKTTFSLATDAWDFEAIPTIDEPFTQRGMAAVALYWFTRLKQKYAPMADIAFPAGGMTAGVKWGNRRNMHIISAASKPAIVFSVGQTQTQQPAIDADYRAIAAAMIMSGDNPVPIWVVQRDLQQLRVVLATSITPDAILVYDPMSGNKGSGGLIFDPTTHALRGYVPNLTDTPLTDIYLVVTNPYSFYDQQAILTLMDTYSNPSTSNTLFPQVTLRTQHDSAYTNNDSIFVIDTLSMWTTCDACTGKGVAATFNPTPTPTNGEVLPSWLWTTSGIGGSFSAPGGSTLADLRGGFRLNSAIPNYATLVVVQTGTCGSGSTKYACWIDATVVEHVYRPRTELVVPLPIDTIKPNKPANFSVILTFSDPKANYEWDYADGSAIEKTGTTKSVTHTWKTKGTYKMFVRAYHSRTTQLVGIDSANIIVDGCADTFTDARDGNVYKQECIGQQVWMSENLRFNASGSLCYAGLAANCDTYGRFYTLTQALAGSAPSSANPSGVRGVCAAGWHLPSTAEWLVLVNRFGGPTAAGTALRSTTTWQLSGGGIPGTNASKMNVIASGVGSVTSNTPVWRNQGIMANLLGSDDAGLNTAGGLVVLFNDNAVRAQGIFKIDFSNVRCVQD